VKKCGTIRPRAGLLFVCTMFVIGASASILGFRNGVGIANRIQQVTRGKFRIEAGSLFPALHRLEAKGWIEGNWGETEEWRRARFYSLTAEGQRQYNAEKRNWRRTVRAVNTVLELLKDS